MIILVAGSSRSGKSTLVKRFCKSSSFSHLPVDAIISTMEKLYPETGMSHFDDNREFSPKLARFLAELCRHIAYEDMDMLIDVYQLYPADYDRFLRKLNIPIVYLGYPGMAARDKLDQIRDHQRKIDWTTDLDDRKMMEIIAYFIAEGEMFYRQCRELGLPFFDTGTNFEQAIGDALVKLGEFRSQNNPSFIDF